MKLGIIGCGYVGLVTGATFAELGNNVVCVDKDKKKIESLICGKVPIYEPGLEEIIRRNVKEKKLTFTTNIKLAVRVSEIIFITVGTPAKENGETDLSQVKEVAIEIGKNLKEDKVVVNKSTSPVGTGEMVRELIYKYKKKNIKCEVVCNPEFLREGSAIADAMAPDRIVLGVPNRNVAMKLIELYSVLEKPMIITSVRSAEMIKYASNAFLAMKISFINSIANLCDKVGADVEEVVRGLALDKRISPHFLKPGIGFGGSCFPKDTESLYFTSQKYNCSLGLVRETILINKEQPKIFINKMKTVLKKLNGKRAAVLGLSFKPETDDIRESVSLVVIRLLLEEGVFVNAYDPIAIEKCKEVLSGVNYYDDVYQAIKGVDFIVIATDWNKFKQLDFKKVKSLMKGNFIFDGRNIYDPAIMKKYGFNYYCIGRPPCN